jgi:integrase
MFQMEVQAVKFRGMVDAAGQRYPAGWVPGFGFGAAPVEQATALNLREWYPRAIAARPRASADLKKRYLRQFDIYVPDWLADKPLTEITTEDAGVWVTSLTEAAPVGRKNGGKRATRPAAPKTAHNVFGTVSSVMKQAVQDEHVRRNVFSGLGIGLKDRSSKEQVHLDGEEFELVHAELAPKEAELARWLFQSGMRWGEATALQWRDIDYDASMASVRRAWKRLPDNSYALGKPKTPRSNRTIVMPAEMLAAIRVRDPRYQKVRASDPSSLEEFIFGRDGHEGEQISHSVYYEHWLAAVGRAQENGLLKRPRIHDLRHSHATLLLAAGVDIVTVSLRLGHSSVAITGDTYGHQSKGANAMVLAALEDKSG